MGSDFLQTSSTSEEGKPTSEEHSDALVGVDVLPDEILDAFFLELDLFSLLQAAQVNTTWHSIISGDFPRYLKASVEHLYKKHPEDAILEKFVELIKLKESDQVKLPDSNRIFQSLSPIAFSKVKVERDKRKSAEDQLTEVEVKDELTEADNKFFGELEQRLETESISAKKETLDTKLLAFYAILWRRLGQNSLWMAARHSLQAVELLLQQARTIQTAMWTQTDGYGYNALMFAAQHPPKVLPNLLKWLAEQEPWVQETVWEQTNIKGWNALMYALSYPAKALPDLLKWLAKQEPSVQETVWGQTNSDGRNILALTVQYRPEALPELLKWLAKQEPALQEKIWAQTDKYGHNVLGPAVQYRLEALPELLKWLAEQKPALQENMWAQKDEYGWTIWELTARYHPEALYELLKWLAKQEPSVQETVWGQTNSGGWNILALTVQYQPEALHELLKWLAKQEPALQEKIWAQTDQYGRNVLLLAVCYHPETLHELFKWLSGRKPALQENMWAQIDLLDWSAMMRVALKRPEVLPHLLAGLAQQKKSVQERIWPMIYPTDCNLLICAALQYPEVLTPLLVGLAEQKESVQATVLSNVDAQHLRNCFSVLVQPSVDTNINNSEAARQAAQLMLFKELMKRDMEKGRFAYFKRSHLYKKLGQKGEGGVTTMEQVRMYAEKSSGSFFFGESRTRRLMRELGEPVQKKTPGCFSGLFCR